MQSGKSHRTLAQEAFVEYLDRLRRNEPADRATFLAGQPAEVQPELERIFEDYEVLRRLSGDVVHGLKPGRLIGDYRLIEEIGRGGMAVVWEAEQLSLGRQVALKILHPHLSLSSTSQRRFQIEAEAGGRLTHPAIVTVYEVGEHEGVHYIAQELITGGFTLADLLAEKRERLELDCSYWRSISETFARVTEALEVAHRAGVIHRDIKPGNILLTESGEPKLSDFGLAKIQDELGLSRTGEWTGTPFYMSPEQAAARRTGVDARTDIFSMGATLYEALTLTRPFEGDSSREIIEKILNAEPSDPRRLRSRLPRDLAVVCMKALEKKPERRYSSAAELAADLRRYLNDEPIQAKPPTPAGRAVRWTRRHPVISVSGAISLAAFLAVTWSLVNSRTAQEAAERSRNETAQALDLTQRLIEMLDPSTTRGKDESRDETLARSVRFASEGLKDRPELRAGLLMTIGRVYQGLGKFADSAPLLEEALSIARKAHGPEDARTLVALQRLARTYEELDRFPDAEALLRPGLDAARATLGQNDPLFLQLLSSLFLLYVREENDERIKDLSGTYGNLEDVLKQALDRQRGVLPSDHPVVLETQTGLARLFTDERRYDEAERIYSEILEVQRRTLGDDHPSTLATRLGLLKVYNRQARRQEADDGLRPLIKDMKRVLPPDHPLTLKATWRLAVNLVDSGRHAEAEPLYREVIEGMTRTLGANHIDTLRARTGLGIVMRGLYLYPEAEVTLATCLADLRRVAGTGHSATLICRRALCEVFVRQHRWKEYESLIRETLTESLRAHGGEHLETFTARSTLADCLESQGQLQDAEEERRAVIRTITSLHGEDYRQTLGERCSLARVLAKQGRTEQAETELREIFDRACQTYGERDVQTMQICQFLGASLCEHGGRTEAHELLLRTYEFFRTTLDREANRFSAFLLATCYHGEGNDEGAEPFARAAMEDLDPRDESYGERKALLDEILTRGNQAPHGSAPNDERPK